MSNIIEDVFEDIEVKPNKSKFVIKWIIRISGILIAAAFIVGQIKVNYFNRLNKIETNIDELKTTVDKGFNSINERVDKVYTNGFEVFSDFNEFNKQELELIIDYGNSDKNLLKRMLEVNRLENKKIIQNKIEVAKKN